MFLQERNRKFVRKDENHHYVDWNIHIHRVEGVHADKHQCNMQIKINATQFTRKQKSFACLFIQKIQL